VTVGRTDPDARSSARPTASILLVEDEEAIADALAFSLANEGFQVATAADGESALEHRIADYDVVILDLNLPRLSGIEVCRRIRRSSIVPILMLTARTGELDRVLGLEVGADDYVPKPFSTAELVSRVRALLRRTEMERTNRTALREIGALRLNLAEQTAWIGEREVPLTQSEFRLLSLLASEPERAFGRREIVEQLWRSDHVGSQRTCDVHVKNLRRKIERDPAHPQRIVTVRGVGYMLRAVD
jgi:DNA-binding response OmpR family regulator